MGRPHRGSPVSCAKIRQRLPELAKRLPCDCTFPSEGSYANPTLHARGLPATAAPADDRPLPELIDALVALERRLAQVQAERDATRRGLTVRLAREPGGAFVHEGQRWEVQDLEGIPALRAVPGP
jgi:hypothetical protein